MMLAPSELLALGKCPECGSKLIDGPRGGESRNMYCSNRWGCREGFNVLWFKGQVIWWQRIGKIDDARFQMYADKKSH